MIIDGYDIILLITILLSRLVDKQVLTKEDVKFIFSPLDTPQLAGGRKAARR